MTDGHLAPGNKRIWSPETMAKHPPSVVMALSLQVGKEPMEWKEYEDRVVIIFTTGQKMVFHREELSPTMHEYFPEPPTTTRATMPIAPVKPTPAIKHKTPAIVGAQHAVPKHAGKKK